MLNVSRQDKSRTPFPHVNKDGIIPAELFNRLKADYPSGDNFEAEADSSNSVGSRVGAGTGFDIYRGDAAYDDLIATSDAWREFDAYINSPAFIETFLEVFEDDLDELGCQIEVAQEMYDRSFLEPRETLTPKRSIKELVRDALPKRRSVEKKKVDLFTRLDIERSLGGYRKPPHCDRPNRLCSLIIYFTDIEAEGIEGGELQIFAHKKNLDPRKCKRHPNHDDVVEVAVVKPKENRGVFFPCSNNSYHGVNPVLTKGKARDFLYINISANEDVCW